MMNIFDRDFSALAPENRGDVTPPPLTGEDGKLFKAVTQETVEMDRRVNVEKGERVAEDVMLQKEIDKTNKRHADDVKAIGDLINGINAILAQVDAKLKDLEARVSALENH